MYGDVLNPHADLKDGWTLLYCECSVCIPASRIAGWLPPVVVTSSDLSDANTKENWNSRLCKGETAFYSDEDEPLHVVAPRPGRVIIFDANIRHRAGAPDRECFRPRITVALKFKS